jgi:hypothetical protein
MSFFNFARRTPAAPQSVLDRLSGRERDLRQQHSAAEGLLEQARAERNAVLDSGDAAGTEAAIAKADGRVAKADALARGFAAALASVQRQREVLLEQRKAAEDQARRRSEAAKIEPTIDGLTEAVERFERAAQHLAASLTGSLGGTTRSAPVVAASLRIGAARFAAESQEVIEELRRRRDGVLDGSEPLGEAATPALKPLLADPAQALAVPADHRSIG